MTFYDGAWHRYTYDQLFDVDLTDAGKAGRVTVDELLDGYDGATVATTTYAYYSDVAAERDLDVETKTYDAAGTEDDTVSTYFQGDGSGIDSQWLETYMGYYAIVGNVGDNKWHRYTYDTAFDVDGDPNNGFAGRTTKDEELDGYNGSVVSVRTYVYHNDLNERVHIEEAYNNEGLTKNAYYEKYTYEDNAASTLDTKTFFFDGITYPGGAGEIGEPDNLWHVSSNFTVELADGMVHAQRDDIYSDAGLTDLVQIATYTYFQSGRIRTKNLQFAENGNTRYDYYDENFDHNGDGTVDENEHYGRLYKVYTNYGKTFTYEAYYAGTDLKALMHEDSPWPGDLYYFYNDYTINYADDPNNEIGFRKEEANGTTYERRLRGGEYHLYKKFDSVDNRTYWYYWDSVVPGRPGWGIMIHTPVQGSSGWHVARPFNLASADPMNPEVDWEWDHPWPVAEPTDKPEFGAWPPAAIDAPVAPALAAMQAAFIDDDATPDANVTEDEEDLAAFYSSVQAEIDAQLAIQSQLSNSNSSGVKYTIVPQLAEKTKREETNYRLFDLLRKIKRKAR